jgi:ferredoxin-NADP reductase
MAEEFLHAQIIRSANAGGGLVDIEIRYEEPRTALTYNYGQYVVVEVENDRGYFAVTDVRDNAFVRILVRAQSGISSELARAKVGTDVLMTLPVGGGFGTPRNPPIFVVTGSGISAVLAWLRAETVAGRQPELLFGVWNHFDVPLADELTALIQQGAIVTTCESGTANIPRVSYSDPIPSSLTQPSPFIRFNGRVQAALGAVLSTRAQDAPPLDVVAVGQPELLTELAKDPRMVVFTNL